MHSLLRVFCQLCIQPHGIILCLHVLPYHQKCGLQLFLAPLTGEDFPVSGKTECGPGRAGFCEAKPRGGKYYLFLYLSLRLRLWRIHLTHQRQASRCSGTGQYYTFSEPLTIPAVP